jgi:hypothetical protein
VKYRKKPVVIDAIHFDGSNINEIWDAFGAGDIYGPTERSESAFIDTSEGTMEARPGDWIIRGIKGELYPCKPDIFEATYESADTKVSDAQKVSEQASVRDLRRWAVIEKLAKAFPFGLTMQALAGKLAEEDKITFHTEQDLTGALRSLRSMGVAEYENGRWFLAWAAGHVLKMRPE